GRARMRRSLPAERSRRFRRTALARAPHVAGPGDHSHTESLPCVVERPLQSSLLLVVVPERERTTAPWSELLGAHTNQPHGVSTLDLIEQGHRGLADALTDLGGLDERGRAADRAEVG